MLEECEDMQVKMGDKDRKGEHIQQMNQNSQGIAHRCASPEWNAA